jgi:hypothetical protein
MKGIFMPSEGFREKLFALEDRHNIRLCVHEYLSSGRVSLTVYRVVEEEKKPPFAYPSGCAARARNLTQ